MNMRWIWTYTCNLSFRAPPIHLDGIETEILMCSQCGMLCGNKFSHAGLRVRVSRLVLKLPWIPVWRYDTLWKPKIIKIQWRNRKIGVFIESDAERMGHWMNVRQLVMIMRMKTDPDLNRTRGACQSRVESLAFWSSRRGRTDWLAVGAGSDREGQDRIWISVVM